MTFDEAEEEIRQRLADASLLLNHLRADSSQERFVAGELHKIQRAYMLVSLYAALERSVNVIVEATLEEISGHGSDNLEFKPEMYALIHYPRIKSIRDCASNRMIDRSVEMFLSSNQSAIISEIENPLGDRLQNVDGGTLNWVAELFCCDRVIDDRSDLARLSHLRERRNAVSHGREPAARVGERFSIEQLAGLYDMIDSIATTFLLKAKDLCSERNYLRAVA